MKIKSNLLLIALLLSTIALPVCGQDYQAESARLATLLHWQAGSAVAEIGAGEGEMALDVAQLAKALAHDLKPRERTGLARCPK